jgi:hypothetical protein
MAVRMTMQKQKILQALPKVRPRAVRPEAAEETLLPDRVPILAAGEREWVNGGRTSPWLRSPAPPLYRLTANGPEAMRPLHARRLGGRPTPVEEGGYA